MRLSHEHPPFMGDEADCQSADTFDDAELGSLRPEPPYTLEELSQVSRKSTRTLRRYVRDGTLPARKIGRTWLVAAHVARAWLGELLGS